MIDIKYATMQYLHTQSLLPFIVYIFFYLIQPNYVSYVNKFLRILICFFVHISIKFANARNVLMEINSAVHYFLRTNISYPLNWENQERSLVPFAHSTVFQAPNSCLIILFMLPLGFQVWVLTLSIIFACSSRF